MAADDRFDTRPQIRSPQLGSRENALPGNPEAELPYHALSQGRFPNWLHRKLPVGRTLWDTGNVVEGHRLHTVCEEAKCPNRLECYAKGTATFLALGAHCTRSCGFCAIGFAKTPPPPDDDEPERIAASAALLRLAHVVVTMVARDDLPDGGARHMARIIAAIRTRMPTSTVEVLTSDFMGDTASLDILLEAAPEIFNHNLETVRELTPTVRHTATYDRSLSILSYIKRHSGKRLVKSGIMVGLGESQEQVERTLVDLAHVGCDIVTLGQYLQSSRKKLAVRQFVEPELFSEYAELAKKAGIRHVYAGPFIRSSYNAGLIFQRAGQDVRIESG